MKTIISKLDFLKKVVIIQWIATKLIEQIPDSTNTKEYYQSYLLRKKQTGKTVKNNCSTIKNYRKQRYCWQKIKL